MMLKVCMVGMGGISGAHRNAWKEIPEVQVVGVCDIREEKKNAAAEDMNARGYDDCLTMLKAEKPDILDICLPTYLHADYAIMGMENGAHVLTEKPISLKKEDIARIYDTAKRCGKNFMVAQVLRFWPEYMALKEACDSGKYGALLSGSMTRLGHTPQSSWDDWMKDPERSGLVPFDLHIHDLDFMVYAFGKPENVQCHRAKNERQDYFNAVYEYPGFFICAEAAWFDCDFTFRSAYRFQFEKAVMELRDSVLTIYHQDNTSEEFKAEEALNTSLDLPKSNAYYNEIRYFVDCVLEGKPCEKVKAEELHTVLELIEKLG